MRNIQLVRRDMVANDHHCVQTSCGRTLDVGTMKLGDPRRPIGRVTMRIGKCPQCGDGSWAAMTPGEARQLGTALLAQATEADASNAEAAGQAAVEVTREGGDSYRIAIRGHSVLVDQPLAAGGQDQGATPTELLAGALASCVAYYSGRYLRRHELDPVGMRVRADFEMADDGPARISELRISVHVPQGVPEERRRALLAVASHCTVHNTLRQAPYITVTLD